MTLDRDILITGIALKQVILKYIPNQFIKNIDFSKLGFDSSEKNLSDGWIPFLQKIIDNGCDEMGVLYENGQVLAEKLRRFLMFPSNHRFFGFDITDNYYKNPEILWSPLPFISKQDLFVHLQQHLFDIIQEKPTLSLIMVLLKTSEQKLDGCYEFVDFNETFVVKSLTISKLLKTDGSTLENRLEDILSDWTSEQLKVINSVSEKYKNQCKNEKEYEKKYQKSCHVLKTVKKFIDSNPEKFLPNSATLSVKNSSVLRVFDSSGCQFVFISELYNAIYLEFKRLSPNNKLPNYEEEDGYLRAIHVTQIAKFATLIDGIELLSIKLSEPPLSLVPMNPPIPIMTHTGEYYVAASDVCGYMQDYWISAMNLFLKMRKDQWHLFEKYMEWFRKEIRMEARYIVYISLEKFNSIIDYTNEYFKEFENIPMKTIKKVRKIGFTALDFKKEVKRLKLVDLLPECEQFSDELYASYMPMKKQKSLGLKEMMTLLKICIKNAILCRYPEMVKFIKYQLEEKCEGECWDGMEEPAITVGRPVITCEPTPEIPKIKEVDPATDEEVSSDEEGIDSVSDSDQGSISSSDEEAVESVEEDAEIEDPIIEELIEMHKRVDRNNAEILLQTKNFEKIVQLNSRVTDENIRLISTNSQLTDRNNQLVEEIDQLESKLKISEQKTVKDQEQMEKMKNESEQKTEKMQEQMDKVKNESDRNVRKMEMEKKKENAENRKIMKELTEFQAKLSKKVTELESHLEEEKEKTQKVEQEAKQQKIESHRKFVNLETENKKLSKSLEQQKNDQDSLKLMMKKEYSEKLNQMKNHLNERDLKIESIKKELNSEKRGNSEFREMSNVIKKSMEEELKKKTRETEGMTLKIANLESLLKDSEERAEKTKREAIQHLQTLFGSNFNLDSNQEITDKNAVINELQNTVERLSGQVFQQNLTINALLNKFGTVKQEFKCTSTQTEEQNEKSEDDECGICLSKMNPNEHIFECNHCQKETHFECSQKWFQQNSTCVHCRGLVRLSSEFPPLS